MSTAAQPVPKPGIQFTETMRGYFAKGETGDYQAAADKGQQQGSPFQFTLTIASDDLDDMLANPDHAAGMTGTATAPALSDKPMTVSEGVFQLFVNDPANVDTKNMLYRMKLTAADNHVYFFTGFKVVHPNPVWDVWHDTSTLYITVYDGPNEAAPILGKGVLHILPADFAVQMTTLKVTNAASPEDAPARDSALRSVLRRNVIRRVWRSFCEVDSIRCRCASTSETPAAGQRSRSVRLSGQRWRSASPDTLSRRLKRSGHSFARPRRIELDLFHRHHRNEPARIFVCPGLRRLAAGLPQQYCAPGILTGIDWR